MANDAHFAKFAKVFPATILHYMVLHLWKTMLHLWFVYTCRTYEQEAGIGKASIQSWVSYFMKVVYYILLVTFMKKEYITVTYYSIKKVTPL